jgi:hypothetical protein
MMYSMLVKFTMAAPPSVITCEVCVELKTEYVEVIVATDVLIEVIVVELEVISKVTVELLEIV